MLMCLSTAEIDKQSAYYYVHKNSHVKKKEQEIRRTIQFSDFTSCGPHQVLSIQIPMNNNTWTNASCHWFISEKLRLTVKAVCETSKYISWFISLKNQLLQQQLEVIIFSLSHHCGRTFWTMLLCNIASLLWGLWTLIYAQLSWGLAAVFQPGWSDLTLKCSHV